MKISFVFVDDQNVKDNVHAVISKVEKAFGLEIQEISIKQQGDLRLYNFKADAGSKVIRDFEEWDCTQKLEVYLDFKVNTDE